MATRERLLTALAALALIALLTSVAAVSSSLAGPPAPSPTIVAQAGSAEPDTTEKRRVRKPRTKEKKPPPPDKSATESEDEEDDWFATCLGGCLGSFFASLVSSDSDDSEDDELVTPAAPAKDFARPEVEADPAPDLTPLPYEAVVRPLNPEARDVALWSWAGGQEANAQPGPRLPAETRVRVTERVTYASILWVNVAVVAMPETTGWVRARDLESAADVSARSDVSPPAAELPAPAEPVTVRPPRWTLATNVAFPLSVRESINEEYNSPFEVGAEACLFVTGSLNVQSGFAYLRTSGEPLFEYVIGSTTESPTNSRLDAWRFDLGFGQEIRIPGSVGFFDWSIGPCLFRVRERAEISVLDASDTVVAVREDKLTAWKLGGEAKIGGGALVDGESVYVAGHVRFALLPWDAAQEKSLTLDFLEEKSIGVVSFEFGIGYRFH